MRRQSSLSEVRAVTGVAFQQAPEYAADDLVLRAVSRKEQDDVTEMPIAVRRTPKLTEGDEKSEQLITQLLQVTTQAAHRPQTRTVAIAVAGKQSAASQLSLLAYHAHRQHAADRFFSLINTPAKFNGKVRTRLRHVERLVKKGLQTLRLPADDAAAKKATFELLSHLTVMQPRLEAPDDSDWGALIGQLMPTARGQSPQAAVQLRDRLEVLTATYAPAAADLDKSVLRRDVHDYLESTYNRNARAWTLIGQLDSDWRATVRREIGAFGGCDQARHLGRSAALQAIRSAIDAAETGLIVHGQSGVGRAP